MPKDQLQAAVISGFVISEKPLVVRIKVWMTYKIVYYDKKGTPRYCIWVEILLRNIITVTGRDPVDKRFFYLESDELLLSNSFTSKVEKIATGLLYLR